MVWSNSFGHLHSVMLITIIKSKLSTTTLVTYLCIFELPANFCRSDQKKVTKKFKILNILEKLTNNYGQPPVSLPPDKPNLKLRIRVARKYESLAHTWFEERVRAVHQTYAITS